MILVLVDSSIWADHIAKNDSKVDALLTEERILCHPVVIGEISMGNLKKRALTLRTLRDLSRCLLATPEETWALVESHPLYGSGLQWGDAQLLASALKSGVKVWTRDRRMREFAEELGCGFLG